MPFNGSNTFTVVNTFVPGTTILSSAVNTNFTDIATGLSDCVTRDAQGAVTGNLLFSSTGFVGLPSGTTAQRPVSASAGYFRFNSTTVAPEFFDGTNWDAVAATIIDPQGYLTLTNLAGGGPIIAADVIAATSVYYSPYLGQICPIYNGTNFVNQIFTEQTLTLASQHVSSSLYDVFAFLNSGVFTIATGPAWSTITAGSCARGTGAGTTQLQRLTGILTNQNSMTARNGATTYTIAANQGTYLGSLFIDSVAGQVTCHRSYGQSRKFGVWNAYNRVPIVLLAGDSTASWTDTPATWRQSHANTANFIMGFSGLPEEIIQANFFQDIQSFFSNSTSRAQIAIGINSTTVPTGFIGGQTGINAVIGSGENIGTNAVASTMLAPSLGLNQFNTLEQAPQGSTNNTFGGTSANMQLTLSWRG